MGVVVLGLSYYSQAESAQHQMLNRPSTLKAFEKYKMYYEGDQTFKAFVLANDGALSWRIRPTPQAAIDDAMTSCASNTGLAGCRLFAIGNTIVWDMSAQDRKDAIATYGKEKPQREIVDAPLSSSALWGFDTYLTTDDCDRFKVFMLAENGAWGKLTRKTYDEAFEETLLLCDQYARRRGLCRLFAVGNTVVWEMAEDELSEVIQEYRKPRMCE
jgi:hypothetical protein